MGSHWVHPVVWALLLTTVLSACGGYQIALVTVTPEGGAEPPPVESPAFTPILPEPTPSVATPYPAWMATLAPALTSAPAVSPTESAPPTLVTGATLEPTHTVAPSATETLVPPTAVPSATPLPTAPPLPPAVRVNFAAGGTSALLVGHIPAHGMARYVLRASARQLLQANVESAQTVYLNIQGDTGVPLKDGSGAPLYRGTLPVTQDYYFAVIAGDTAADYALQIIIPVRIAFARGTTAGAVEGTLPPYSRNYYVLGAQASQLMMVDVAPSEGLKLSIQGLDGAALLCGMGESTSYTGILPRTQDYLITVHTADSAANYALDVRIPERIRFAPGAVGAVREGTLGVKQQHAYVLGAMAGQEMRVRVTAPEDTVQRSIYGVDGTVLMSGMGGGAEFEGNLPSTQDYVVSIRTGPLAVSYTLEVTID